MIILKIFQKLGMKSEMDLGISKSEIALSKKFESKIYHINVILNIIISVVISCIIQMKSKTLLRSDVSSKSRFWWGF